VWGGRGRGISDECKGAPLPGLLASHHSSLQSDWLVCRDVRVVFSCRMAIESDEGDHKHACNSSYIAFKGMQLVHFLPL